MCSWIAVVAAIFVHACGSPANVTPAEPADVPTTSACALPNCSDRATSADLGTSSPDPAVLIRFDDADGAAERRAKLRAYVWGEETLPEARPMLTEIGTTVNASVACELTIPTVEGQDLDPDHVNVKIKKPDGTTVDVLQDNKDCNNGADGWQYSADGKKVILCGQACEGVKQNPDDKVTVEFGCQTKVK